jgi:hypothetical protein
MDSTQLVESLQFNKETGQGHLVALAALELDAHELLNLATTEQPFTQRPAALAPRLGIEIVVVGTMLHRDRPRMPAIGIPSAPLEGQTRRALIPAQ